jgi:hypothetical protein
MQATKGNKNKRSKVVRLLKLSALAPHVTIIQAQLKNWTTGVQSIW